MELIVEPRWLIPVDPPGVWYTDHAVLVRDGRIIEVGPVAHLTDTVPAAPRVRLPSHALIPGLVNAHTHAAMTLLRGFADDLPLDRWLREHIWPAEQALVGGAFVDVGSRLAMAEMLLGGTTCFNDMYMFPDVVAEAAERLGIRAAIGLIVFDFPTAWARTTEEYLDRADELIDRFRNHATVHPLLAPHAPYTVSDAALAQVEARSSQHGLAVHIHLHETAHEVASAVASDGRRPFARLEALGLINERLLAVHATQLTEHEIARLAEVKASVAHCPESNLKLASGFCPVTRLQAAGVNLGLGTDGAASNNDLDLLGEMRTAALLAKGVSGDPEALPAASVLHMATLGGARALGLDDHIGSIAPGKAADMVALDLGRLQTQPVYDPISHVVYATGREQVSHVWVSGAPRVVDGVLTQIDQPGLLAEVEAWRERIRATVGTDMAPEGGRR